MPETPTQDRITIRSFPKVFGREPVVLALHREQIEKTAKLIEHPLDLSLDAEGHLVDIVGNSSNLIKGGLAKELVERGYPHLSQMEDLAQGRVSIVRDAGPIVLKEGIYSDKNRDRYNLVIAFRHIGQATDITFFTHHLGERHIPPTEALLFPGHQGPITLIAQEKVSGTPLNKIEDLSNLTPAQREELLSLLERIQRTYDETGRFPDIHGRPLKGIRGFRKADIRHTDNIIVGDQSVFLTDTDDIARNHSVETFKGWLACRLYSRKLKALTKEVEN